MKRLFLWISTAATVCGLTGAQAIVASATAAVCIQELPAAARPVRASVFGDRRHIEFLRLEKEEHGTASMAVDVVDPQHLLDPEPDIFQIAGQQAALVDRLRFLIVRLHSRRERLVITVVDTRTEWVYEPRLNLSDSPIVINYRGQQLREHPDLALVGFTTQIFYRELLRYFDEMHSVASQRMDERLDQIQSKVAAAGIACDRWRILDLLFQRTVWYAKQTLLRQIGPEQETALRTGRDKLHHPETDTEYLHVPIGENGNAVEGPLREHFARFYRLDRRLVDLIWDEPLPDGWDFPMANPPRLRLVSALNGQASNIASSN